MFGLVAGPLDGVVAAGKAFDMQKIAAKNVAQVPAEAISQESDKQPHARNWKNRKCGKRIKGVTYHILGPLCPKPLAPWGCVGYLPNHSAGPARFACAASKFSKKKQTNFITRTLWSVASATFMLQPKREPLLHWTWLSAAATTLAQPLFVKIKSAN